MTLAWSVVPAPAPVGALTVGETTAGLVLVTFGARPEAARRAADRLGLQAARHDGGAAAAQIGEYLAGERTSFDLPLDWSLTSGRQRHVLQVLHQTVEFGRTITYGELAARTGQAEHPAARGMGSIMGSNPVPVVVPCHRVLASDGLGGFGGGRAAKEWLLAHEGVLPATLDLF
ncbi:methylated-DNA--[protein]-cysteine S-methyltransferase [Georgenia alba]|uniref:Methylated-DNA--protein-cysteine methyltransferase n=1 Tax=Georgenia alba TaxID=2233858 RepID=A0ABW2Q4Z7_9MICO